MRILRYITVLTAVVTLSLDAWGQIRGDEPMITDLTPRVDTLWTRQLSDLGMVDFSACAMGGTPRVLIVASQKEQGQPGSRKCLIVVQPETGDTLFTISNHHTGGVQHMSFARNANIFSTAEAGLIKVWTWPEMEVVREFTGPSDYRPAALLTSDGKRLFDAKAGVMYDVISGDTVWSWKQTCVFAYPKLTPDDRYLIVHDCGINTPSNDRGVLLDAHTGQELGSFVGGSGEEYIKAMAVSDDGRYVAISRSPDDSPKQDGSVTVYDRVDEAVVLRKSLPITNGGAGLEFVPQASGLFVMRNDFMLSSEWDSEYLRAWKPEATHRFSYWGRQFNADWTLNYGCNSGRIAVSRFVLSTVPVQEISQTETSTLYPNPADGMISIRVTDVPDGGIRFEIVSAIGQVVSNGTTVIVNKQCTINPVPRPVPGSYFIRLLRAQHVLFSSTLIVR